jgi:predicted SAM-dependent methyltransferase
MQGNKQVTNIYFVERRACPACKSDKSKQLYSCAFDTEPVRSYLERFYGGRVDFTCLEGASYILVECADCGLVFQQQAPGPELLNTLYDKWLGSDTTLTRRQRKDGLGFYSLLAQEVMQIIALTNKLPADLSVLDYGMGWGKWALMVKAFGCRSYGYELSSERIAQAQSNGIATVTWEEIGQKQFDFINTEQVFEHLVEPLATLAHLAGGLKDDGILKISVPSDFRIDAKLRIMDWSAPKFSWNSLNPVAPLEHLNCFRLRSIREMARQVGLREMKMPVHTQYQYATAWSGGQRVARNLFTPFVRNALRIQNYVLLVRAAA